VQADTGVTRSASSSPAASIEQSRPRPRARRPGRPTPGLILLSLAAGLFTLVILLPVLAIFLRVLPQDTLWQVMQRPLVIEALRLSLMTSLLTLALSIGLGTPLAYLLARHRFPGQTALDSLIELPMVLPPAVAGIGLLAALGPKGLLGGSLDAAGIELSLTTAGVVVALTFVASPFYLRQAIAAFAAVDRTLLDASRTLGVSEARGFGRVMIPAAMPGLVAGGALALGRALGEFGATLMFAGSFQGITQTVPLAIYDRFNTDFDGALALSAVLVAVSGAILLSVKLVHGAEVLGGPPR